MPRPSMYLFGGLVAATTLSAQADKKAGAPAGPLEQPAAFAGLKFRFPGPFDGGRVSRVTGIAGDPAIYYFTSAAGGVWKSTDGGIRWSPLTDKEPIASTGSIAVAPSDPNIVYVGAGEANIRGDVS